MSMSIYLLPLAAKSDLTASLSPDHVDALVFLNTNADLSNYIYMVL